MAVPVSLPVSPTPASQAALSACPLFLPAVAFPIMMGSCAFLMPLASAKFVKAGAYNRKASLGITVGGIFGVLLAVYIVKSLPLAVLTWLVMVVIFITALTLIRSGVKK